MQESKENNFEFIELSSKDILKFTSMREGETKIGESIVQSENKAKKYLILGVCEDLGPQANGGNTGAKNAFLSFLPKFLSMQSNIFLSGENILVSGYIEAKIDTFSNFNSVPNVIDELDDFVIEILSPYLTQNYIPIVIGGGHNNAYPILKAISKQSKNTLAVVNCDAHADFRKTDFRHSGNPFSWAFQEKIISKYAVLGLHQSYNNQFIIDELNKNQFFHSWLDDYVYESKSLNSDFQKVLDYFGDLAFGIELDMDSIAYMPSSASSPSGISLEEARSYISFFAKNKRAKYLHLPEAAPKNIHEELCVGKSLAYLVSDFIKNNNRA